MGELEELRAHVDKLTAIVDEMTPCDDDCDVRAVFSWVDPADLQRVRDLRHARDAELAEWRTLGEAIHRRGLHGTHLDRIQELLKRSK